MGTWPASSHSAGAKTVTSLAPAIVQWTQVKKLYLILTFSLHTIWFRSSKKCNTVDFAPSFPNSRNFKSAVFQENHLKLFCYSNFFILPNP